MLEQRAGGASKAPLSILDVSQLQLQNGFSEQLLLKMAQHLKKGNQVLVFINRRGYAPVLQCQSCGWMSECDNCIAQMTVHARPPALRCHHCEKVETVPRACPNCQSADLQTLGLGTQKLEQFLNQHFADSPVLRVDRDSTRNKNSLDEMLQQINTGESCILLGTQMLAKGHHFPNVTLVAILDADIGLFSADFRGQEQMAQTIVQVAGRAGRADKPGEVIIQSRHANHPALNNLTQLTYSEYAQLLMEERQLAGMPPYSRLALLQVESSEQASALNFAVSITQYARSIATDKVELLGPLPAPMEKRAGRFRIQLQCKARGRVDLQKFLGQLCPYIEASKIPNKVRWSLDIDPLDLV